MSLPANIELQKIQLLHLNFQGFATARPAIVSLL